MTPHARLQPSAPTTIVRTSSRPALATLSEPVKVTTMISPNRTSATRSCGSSTRRDESTGSIREGNMGSVPASSEALGDVLERQVFGFVAANLALGKLNFEVILRHGFVWQRGCTSYGRRSQFHRPQAGAARSAARTSGSFRARWAKEAPRRGTRVDSPAP